MEKVTCYNTIISLLIRQYRETAGKSQKEMSEKLGITAAGWGKIEKGQSTISAGNVLHICNILSIAFGDFYAQVAATEKALEEEGWRVKRELQIEDDTLYQINLLRKPLLSIPGIGALLSTALTIRSMAVLGHKLYSTLIDTSS